MENGKWKMENLRSDYISYVSSLPAVLNYPLFYFLTFRMTTEDYA
jgi:hypothetical protein